MSVLYRIQATAVGGREGNVKSSDGFLNLNLGMPKELGGPGKPAANPEMLFAAGYAACFESAMRFVAREKKIAITSASVTADVGIGPRDDGGFALDIALTAEVGGLDQAAAEQLVAAAHHVCPYSHATKGSLNVRLTTKVV
ncbi:MAG: organic hydroperoxide resistance protein [Alphaproteobacteria bacterium]|jgi:Ohr subfamily peroxiredoxin|nr:organic hydroperoxide resistance protein [Alphaproteobacteria bacterium]